MALSVTCPHCTAVLSLANDQASRARCAHCDQSFMVQEGVARAYVPVAPLPAEQQPANSDRATAVGLGVCVLSVIGVVMSMQSASLLSGTGTIWTGVGLAAAALAAAFFLGAESWARGVASVALVLALFGAGYMEKQLSDKRNEISHMINQLPSVGGNSGVG